MYVPCDVTESDFGFEVEGNTLVIRHDLTEITIDFLSEGCYVDAPFWRAAEAYAQAMAGLRRFEFQLDQMNLDYERQLDQHTAAVAALVAANSVVTLTPPSRVSLAELERAHQAMLDLARSQCELCIELHRSRLRELETDKHLGIEQSDNDVLGVNTAEYLEKRDDALRRLAKIKDFLIWLEEQERLVNDGGTATKTVDELMEEYAEHRARNRQESEHDAVEEGS